MEQAIEREQALNRLAAGYYVCGVVGLIVVSVLVSYTIHSPAWLIPKSITQRLHRLLMGVSIGQLLILPHWLFVAIAFAGINVGILAWKMNWYDLAYLGSRFGWLALCNMCLVIFLAMKNTPLSPIAGKSYRDLNILHRVCGYVTVLEVILHASLFSSGLFRIHVVAELRTPIVYAGAVAGISMLILAITATYLFRRRFYEAFYLLHIFFVLVILISMALHQQDIRTKALIIVIVSIFIWVFDRAIRTIRWLYYGYHGYCTLTPLPHGATKVTMTRSMTAQPGSHALLWIPSIGLIEQHPFTMLASAPVEFVITARHGFTSRLYEKACRKPGVKCRALLEGPYGHIPDLRDFDRVLLIAGGSGATFALALAMNWIREADVLATKKTLHFVWVVRSTNHFQWHLSALQQLRAHPRVNVVLHVTSEGPDVLADDISEHLEASSPVISDGYEEEAKHMVEDLEKNITTDAQIISHKSQGLKRHGSSSNLLYAFQRGRPVVDLLFTQAMIDTSPDERILVTGSGPDQLLSDIQAATGSAIKASGPVIQLHLEAYEW